MACDGGEGVNGVNVFPEVCERLCSKGVGCVDEERRGFYANIQSLGICETGIKRSKERQRQERSKSVKQNHSVWNGERLDCSSLSPNLKKVPPLLAAAPSQPFPRPLFPHQADALNFCKAKTAIPLFLQMRLGKTKVVIEHLRRAEPPVLVVAPLTTLLSWKEELVAEGESETSFCTVVGNPEERKRELSRHCKWFLINYEGILSTPAIQLKAWKVIILDESSRIRNPKSKISRILSEEFPLVQKKVILSGNPAPESPLDFFQQFKFLQGNFMGFENFWKFRISKFFMPHPSVHKWIPKPGVQEAVRKYIQEHSFVLSKENAGLGNLKFYQHRTIPMEDEQKKIIRRIEDEFLLEYGENVEILTKWIPVQFCWMSQVAGGFVNGKLKFRGKMQELKSLLQNELSGESVVVWFRYNCELFEAKRALALAGVSCRGLCGLDSFSVRETTKLAFRNKEFEVLLLQSRVGMFSLDLSVASTSIYYSNYYSHEVRSQSEERIEHPSKKEPLLIVDLVTGGSLDEDVLKSLRKKKLNSSFYLSKDIYAGILKRREK